LARRTLRFVLGTTRILVATRLRELHGHWRRRPPCASVVPRPRADRRSPTLQPSHVVLACDLNPQYLSVWPLARRAWRALAGLEPILVLVAQRREVPLELRKDECVHVFEPIDGVHTALQAQCVRLFYPALVDTHAAVLTSDVDMIPLNGAYFREPLRRIPDSHFVSYRDVLLELEEIPICYNAALPRTWANVSGIESLADVRDKVRELVVDVDYEGVHGGRGWTTDQRTLYGMLVDRGRRSRDVWILDDYYTRFRRLFRTYVEKWDSISPEARSGLTRRTYSDYDCLLPHEGRARELNEKVLELALGAAARRSA
jgi:hypothetical protein